jgi:hypothetical protein
MTTYHLKTRLEHPPKMFCITSRSVYMATNHLKTVLYNFRNVVCIKYTSDSGQCPTNIGVKFRVFTAASMKMAVFCVVAPCCLVEVYRRFTGACCLHHEGNEGNDDGGMKRV